MRQDDNGSGREIGQEVNYQRPMHRAEGLQTPEDASKPTDAPIPILAKLPDIHTPQPARPHHNRPRNRTTRATRDNRLISQSLSMKLLGGGAILLVGLAVVPWMFGDKKPQSSGTEEVGPPAWQQDEQAELGGPAPAFAAIEPSQSPAPEELAEAHPAETVPAPSAAEAPQGIGVPPPATPSPTLPTPPNPSDNAAAVPQGREAPVGPGIPGAAPQAPAVWPQTPQTPMVQVPPHEAIGNPHSSVTGPNAVHARAMQAMEIQPSPTAPAVPSAAGYQPVAEPATPAQTAAWNSRVGSAVPAPPLAPTTAGQPGVARFQGIIESPPVRTTNDRTRPGVY